MNPLLLPCFDRSQQSPTEINLPTHRAAGFSLVEIMVAMVIGMLGMIVMLQVFGAFEGQKRTTTGSSDALSAGAIALYGVQRDIRQSGWGIAGTIEAPLIGCQVTGLSSTGNIVLAPVVINSTRVAAGDDNTDTLLIVYGNGNGTVEGDSITGPSPANGTTYAVHTPTAFNVDDFVVAEPPTVASPCGFVLLATKVKSVLTPNVKVTTASTAGNMQNGKLYNLGATPKVLAYAVRDGNLTVCDYRLNDCSKTTSGFWTPIANNIVMLRAQYGRDRTSLMDGIVDFWDATKNPTETCGVTADNTGWLRISAVRIALVARNSQPEKTVVTAAAPTWMGTTAVVDVSASAPIDVSDAPRAAGFNWDQYRYRVFETVVPLRNITTLGAISGC